MADHALATVTNPTSALTDFTLIVDLSTLPASWWSAVTSSDGTRGRVYKGDGTTRLAADWIDFNDTASTGILRVKWSGTLATTGTQQLWIEPPVTGNAAVLASDTYGSDNAYDSNWEGYWPLHDVNDRTANDYNGTAQGSVVVGDAIGQLGLGTDFDGVNDYIDVTGVALPSGSSHTGSCWVNMTDVTESERRMFFENADGYEVSLGWGADGGVDRNNKFQAYTYDGGPKYVTSIMSPAADTYYLVHTVVDQSTGTISLFVDGELDNSSDFSGTIQAASGFHIGTYRSANDRWMDGILDDVQLHSVVRSADWIAYEYAQTNDQTTFYGTWSWETSGGGTAYEVDLADSVGVTDALTKVGTFVRQVADTAEVSDALSTARTIERAFIDTAGLTDTLATPRDTRRLVTDMAGASDTLATPRDTRRLVTDMAGATDTLATTRDTRRLVTDTAGLTDTLATPRDIRRLVTDMAGASDVLTASRAISRMLTDTAGLTDALDVTLARMVFATIADSVGVTDSLQAAATFSLFVSIADSVGVSDSIDTTAALMIIASITDTVGVTDSMLQSLVRVRSVTDTVGVTDAPATSRAIQLALSSSVAPADVVAEEYEWIRMLLDSGGTTDDVLTRLDSIRTMADTVGVNDAMTGAIVGLLTAAISDTVEISDTLSAELFDAVYEEVLHGMSYIQTQFKGRSKIQTQFKWRSKI